MEGTVVTPTQGIEPISLYFSEPSNECDSTEHVEVTAISGFPYAQVCTLARLNIWGRWHQKHTDSKVHEVNMGPTLGR